MFRSIPKSIGSGRTIKRGTFTTTSASFCIDIREPDSGLVAADPQHPICFHLHLFLFHRKTSWCWSWRLWCWSKYFEHLYSVIYRFIWLKEKSCRCVKIRHTCSSPALCSSLVCLAMCEASAGTSSRASLCAHLVISDFWKIANNLIFSFGKEKNLGPVRSRRTNSASVHDETKWAVTSETLHEILEERSIHHFFHFATVCTAQSVYLAGTRDSLHCHTSWQAHNKFSAKSQKKYPSKRHYRTMVFSWWQRSNISAVVAPK